jgi:hypothetical protein
VAGAILILYQSLWFYSGTKKFCFIFKCSWHYNSVVRWLKQTFYCNFCNLSLY